MTTESEPQRQRPGVPEQDASTRPTSGGGIRSGASRRAMQPLPNAQGGDIPDFDLMRAARRRWPSGVSVVTTKIDHGPDVEYRGITVSAFCIVSLAPPIVLVCLHRDAEIVPMINSSTVFAVSVLDREQQALADLFAGIGPMPNRALSGIAYHRLPSGCPALENAAVWFDCAVDQIVDGGDHVVLFGAVSAIGLGPDSDDPLISYDGSYRRIESS